MNGDPETQNTAAMRFGWALALVGIGGTVLSPLPSEIGGWVGIALALAGLGVVVGGARLRDGHWRGPGTKHD